MLNILLLEVEDKRVDVAGDAGNEPTKQWKC